MSNKIKKIEDLFKPGIFSYNFLVENEKIVYIQKYTSLEAILKKYKNNRISPFTLFISWLYRNGFLYNWLYAFIKDNIDSKSHVVLKDYMTTNDMMLIKNFLDNSFVWGDYNNLLKDDTWRNIDKKWDKFLKDNSIV